MTTVGQPPVVITEPGVYNIPDHEYHADPVPGGSLSASGAKKLLPPSCPAIFRYERTHPPKAKAAFDLGHAAHKMVLGVGPKIVRVNAEDWRTKKAQQLRAAAHADGHVPLLAADLDRVMAMAAALREHPIAGALLDPWQGRPEQSLFWKDTATGIQCRARLDFLRGRVIVDYKSAAAVDLAAIPKAINSYGYHLSAAVYLDAVRALELAERPEFVFIFQAKDPPYLVTVTRIDADSERIGRELWRRAVDIYIQCTDTGRWPDFCDGIAEVSLPPYVIRAHDLIEGQPR